MTHEELMKVIDKPVKTDSANIFALNYSADGLSELPRKDEYTMREIFAMLYMAKGVYDGCKEILKENGLDWKD